jgi:Tol biopolymer transport system component
MSLAPGTRLGSYEILSLLGAGGMGEVYRARDTRLGRDVAIKLLPSGLAGDPERVARFAREARLLAALNHPRIATIHGFEESASAGALVMELVEGPTLEEQLLQDGWRQAKPAVHMAAVFTIARQIAEALEAAHAKGIVHRDLKPANVKVCLDGSVKVLDFGLAKALSDDASGGDSKHLPTMTGSAMRPGTIVGTPAYMSPEQARGDAVDRRTDIWSFGCVLYEMLSGQMPFPGKTISDTIAAILERDPNWNALPVDTPPAIRRLVRRCLEKDAARRLHDIADARLEIEDAANGTSDAPVRQAAAAGRRWIAWTAAMVAVSGAAVTAAWMFRPVPLAPETRLEMNTPPTRDASIAVSPDGRTIAYVVTAAGQPQLWLRSLDSVSPRLLAGTEHATLPFWSPDSRSIGFFADVYLKRIDVDGASVQTLKSQIGVPIGGSWNRDNVILFADSPAGPVSRISALGGVSTAVTRVDTPRQRGHHFPDFLPDGRHFLFFVTGTARGVYVGQLDRPDTTRLFDADGPATYAPPGYLLCVRGGRFYAQRFDPDTGVVKGDPFVMDERVTGSTSASASVTGPIAYRSNPSQQRQLVWLDRLGRQSDKVVYADTAAQGPALSHDGRRIAVYRFADGNMDIWSYDTQRRTWDRLTFDPGDDIFPLWSKDDTAMVYSAVRREGTLNLYRRLLSAPPEREELLLSVRDGAFPMDLSPDDRFLLYTSPSPQSGSDLRALPLDGDRKPFDVVKTGFNDGLGQFAPDGKWIAYQSDKTGHDEVYIRPFPGPGSDVRISTDGGGQPRWNPKGGELFYVAADDRLMAVPVRFSADRATVEPGTPVGLFTTTIGSTATLKYRQQYVVAPDGQSFVMQSVVDGASASPITVILNWKPKG